MPRVPGGAGKQLFGIGLFVEAGDAGQVTTPDNWGVSQGEPVTRLERVVYDPTAAPIFISAASIDSKLASAYSEQKTVFSRVVYDPTAKPPFQPPTITPSALAYQVASDLVRRLVVGSLTAFAAASAMAEPVFVPQVRTAAIAPSDVAAKARKISLPDGYATPVLTAFATATPSEFAYQPADALWPRQKVKPVPRSAFVFRQIGNFWDSNVSDLGGVRPKRKILPDGYAVPILLPLAATPSAFAYQPVEAVWRVQKKILPDGFSSQFRILAATPSAFGYQTVDASWRQQRKVLPDGIAVPLTSPAAAQPIAPSDAVARARRKNLPDGYAAPVSPPVAAAFAGPFTGALANSLTVVRTSLAVRDQASTPGSPPAPAAGRFVPDAPQPGFYRQRIKPVPLSAFVFACPVSADTVAGIACAYSSTTVIKSRVVYDQTAARPVFPPAAPPTTAVELRFVPDAPQNWFRRQKIKPVQQSAFVFAYPVSDNTLAGTHSSATVITSRVVHDQGAARPLFPPVVVVVPPTFHQAEGPAPQRKVSRPGIKLDLEGFERPTTRQQTLFWFETYPALRAVPISARAVRSNLDGFDRPTIQITVTPSFLFETIPPGWTAKPNSKAIGLNLGALQASQGFAPPPAVTPSFLFETIPPPWTAKPNAVAIKADLDGFRKPDALPAPPTSTPAILFDVIPPVQRTLPNRVAIKIDLDGFAWTPQRPQDLTGVIFVPPITTHYPTGGESYYWQVIHKKPVKTDKRCRFVTIDGVLTWICDRLDHERAAEARLQALDLVYDAEGELEPLYEALRVEEATNASEAKRAAATLLMRAIHEAILEDEDDDLLLLD